MGVGDEGKEGEAEDEGRAVSFSGRLLKLS